MAAEEREGAERAERDSTEEWLIEPARRPPTVLELEGRIDTAIELAEAAETAALEIGAASLEAAEQARRAAALAESASAASHAAAQSADSAARAAASAASAAATPTAAAATSPAATPTPPARAIEVPVRPARPRLRPAQPDPFDERLTAFRDRAERVLVRLRRLDAPTPIS